MTSTSFNVGISTDSRNSSKVLKPPGGGSSDIFGSSEPAEPQRKVKTQHLTSTIFGEDSSATSRNKPGNSSFYNVFGSEWRIESSNKSEINLVSDKANSDENKNSVDNEGPLMAAKESETDGKKLDSKTPDNENKLVETPAPAEASSVMNGTASSTTSSVSSSAPTPTSTAPAAGRQRIPPGGFSSGLW